MILPTFVVDKKETGFDLSILLGKKMLCFYVSNQWKHIIEWVRGTASFNWIDLTIIEFRVEFGGTEKYKGSPYLDVDITVLGVMLSISYVNDSDARSEWVNELLSQIKDEDREDGQG